MYKWFLHCTQLANTSLCPATTPKQPATSNIPAILQPTVPPPPPPPPQTPTTPATPTPEPQQETSVFFQQPTIPQDAKALRINSLPHHLDASEVTAFLQQHQQAYDTVTSTDVQRGFAHIHVPHTVYQPHFSTHNAVVLRNPAGRKLCLRGRSQAGIPYKTVHDQKTERRELHDRGSKRPKLAPLPALGVLVVVGSPLQPPRHPQFYQHSPQQWHQALPTTTA